MADNKTKPTKISVAAFIDSITDKDRRADAKALVNIGFSSYHYVYDSGREGDMPVVAFSPRKAATVLYGWSSAEALLPKLGKHTRGKGCLYIKRLSDVDTGVLEEMINATMQRRKKK